jgi:nitroimidazol reductase NimA-like FMN-containing flavoprotein (pyridoxamine 5'-phosphate oxidase superfamily)
MATKKNARASNAPTASRPILPGAYGVPKDLEGSVSWAWAEKRLTDSHNYLIVTVRPDSRPHTMIVWGIWLDNAYYFSTGSTTRKAQNLAANPNCIVCNEDPEEAVIVEGKAQPLKVAAIPERAFSLYSKKYGWKLDAEMGDIYKLTPSKVIAMPEKLFPEGATRWVFR